jgi:hypothetical protein
VRTLSSSVSSGAPAIGVVGFGAEVLHDDFLDVP